MTGWTILGLLGWLYAAVFWYSSKRWEMIAKDWKFVAKEKTKMLRKQLHEVDDRDLH